MAKDEFEKDVSGYRWLEQPAIFCDYFSVEAWKRPGIARFAFGEYTGEDVPPLYRVGLAMPINIAKMLLEELTEAIGDHVPPRGVGAAS